MNKRQDRAYLEMAYSLAEKARGWTSPNPLVGALLVKDGIIIGHGYHKKPGTAHAEIIALQMAGTAARGSTLYVTLEPCIHTGRTPPCVDSLIPAGIKRAFISAMDPNPVVHRRGAEKLREAGISVDTGLLAEKNALLNEFYVKYITRKIPWVTIKAAVSLDGKMAVSGGHSNWITSSTAREYVHLLRGEHDAVLVGSETVLQDNPRLTIRHPQWKGKRLVRVLLDGRLRIPASARLFETLDRGPVLIFTSTDVPRDKAAPLEALGVEVIPVPSSAKGLDLSQILQHLGTRQITSVLVEGGGRVITGLVESRLADCMYLIVAPKLIGGDKAPSFLGGKGIDTMDKAFVFTRIHSFQLGADTVFKGYF
ncbi:MAG: bifunctional diaminohydroxyphosphoribosylaminopyrimidine deaminase/5-amino-6-(5-phosphoribosylamino)uracil reductase RibD [Acidobacteria bacterium]|nr:bifunctional diaminohydroxyphosphoribosylaminopyrimidine deaminase/5-amino-6-(5-phosphoribosylamino)uracil reductase RibD [Acidobacteriota bacterium]